MSLIKVPLKNIKLFFYFITVCLLLTLNSCYSDITTAPLVAQQSTEWEISTPENQGLDRFELESLRQQITLGSFGNIKSLLIARNGYLVFEKYFNGAERDQLHILYSVTKSVASIVTGIVINDKKNLSVNDKIENYFSAYYTYFNSPKEQITVKDLLTMSAGFQWNELSVLYSNPDNDFNKFFSSNDGIAYLLNKNIVNTPGTKFVYNTGLPILQSVILEKCANETVADFTNQKLFVPLGISSWSWNSFQDSITNTGSGLSLRPIDLALIGQLLLNKGSWNGLQIVPQDWINESTQKSISVNPNYDYGYYWWRFSDQNPVVQSLPVNDLYFAWGYSDQFLFVIPSYNMEVIITADNHENDYPIFNILKDYVFEAVLK